VIRVAEPRVSQDIQDDWAVTEGLDVSHLARLLFWSVLAVSSLAGAFIAARTDLGSERITAAWDTLVAPSATTQLAAAMPERPPLPAQVREVQAPPAPLATASAAEVKALSDRVHALAAERERLLARIEAVENSIDVTGSIPKTAAPEAPPAAAATAWASVPIPPPRNYAPFSNMLPFAAEPVTDWVLTSTEFGLELGAETSLDGLRAQWAMLKAQHAALLEGLRPLVAIRENKGSHELRLMVGPLRNAALAARICVVLAKAGRDCRATAFEGQRLALR
jgi:hypothetical protein